MTTRYIDGAAVDIDGDGPAIVCIHGLGGTSNTWTPLLRAMRGFRVIRIDLPGSGRSAGASGTISIERMVETVLAVCKGLDVGAAYFVGHSMGTIICQHVAIRQPQLVKALVLFGPLPCPPEAARPHLRMRAQKAIAGGISAMQDIADAIVQGATATSTREALPLAVAMVRESLMRQDARGYGRTCDALADAQAAVLEDIAVPVLLVTGNEDGVAPPAVAREMARRLPRSRIVIFNRCGHWTTFERPIECAQHLEEFLRRP